MKIFVKDDDGIIYEAFQMNENTYTFSTENKTFKLSLSESKQGKLSEEQKKRMTKSIFSNKEVLDQLIEARKNRDSDFSYYSGDEKEFDKLVDEVNNDR